MKTEWINTKSRQFLKLSAAALTVLVALISLGVPAAATAQNTAQLRGSLPQTQGAEWSWLYTVTIPGYTFQGIETYSTGGGYTEADQLSFYPLRWQARSRRVANDRRKDIQPYLPQSHIRCLQQRQSDWNTESAPDCQD